MENALKRLLVIDRDGTIIAEPPVDFQVDSLAKLHFLPGAIGALSQIARLDYSLVMATNQDGLGTASFPEEDFWPAHNLMMETLQGEGVCFDQVLIDRSMPADNAPTRKPRTGMFSAYMSGGYDLVDSFVIGDRLTDMELAANLGAQGILLQPLETGREMVAGKGLPVALITDDWGEIATFLRLGDRRASVRRTTRETDIALTLDLDGQGPRGISTGLGFLDHMLDQITHHGGVSLELSCKGDLNVDEHHTMEDVAIALGEAIDKALGRKIGIGRYGFALPMDESSALVLLDFGGRSDFEWDVKFSGERIGDVPTQMLKHFFKSLSVAARANIHISARGDNDHHLAEGIFKAFARALRAAVRRDPFSYELPSSKGVL